MGLEELGKRYRGGGKKHGKIATFQIHRGTCLKCGAWRGALGLEPTPDLFVDHMVEVYEEVRRVLRPDGVAWVNMGDCYASGGGAGDQGRSGDRFERAHTQKYLGVSRGSRSIEASGKHGKVKKIGSNRAQRGDGNDGVPFAPMEAPNRSPLSGLKPKDLVGVPWMLAFALRRAGWYLRQDIVWQKPNPMPESTEDRCTKSHEYIFLLSKSERYFYDAEAIKEEAVYGGEDRPTFRGGAYVHNQTFDNTEGGKSTVVGNVKRRQEKPKGAFFGKRSESDDPKIQQAFRAIRETRNKRSVWTVATRPFPQAHFATFPPELIEPCVLAGTSERGACPACRSPWARVSAPTARYAKFLGRGYNDHSGDKTIGMMQNRGENRQNALREEGGIVGKETETIGWYPSCGCDGLPPLPKLPPPPRVESEDDEPTAAEEAALEVAREAWRAECAVVHEERRKLCVPASKLRTVPCVVLDHFGGAGTTGLVADRAQRDAILIEMNPKYAAMALKRIEGDGGLFSKVAAE
jgi:DNA modification methylase